MTTATILEEELAYIEAGRSKAKPPAQQEHLDPLAFATDPIRDRAAKEELFGLAFSGGGIRSATFNLGVLQALAELKLLTRVDYLSTVSGGGYIGSWLTAWIHRIAQCTPGAGTAGARSGEPIQSPVEQVQEKLRASISDGDRTIRFLREHSNYLTPRTGFFGADTWSAVSIYLRNLTLNLAILVGILTAVLLFPRLLVIGFQAVAGWGEVTARTPVIGAVLGWLPMRAGELVASSAVADWVAVVWLLPAVVMAGINLRHLREAGDEHGWEYALSRQATVLLSIVIPAVVAAFFIAVSMWRAPLAVATQAPNGFHWITHLLAVSGWWIALWLILVLVWQPDAWKRRAEPTPRTAEPAAGTSLPFWVRVLAAGFCVVVSGILAGWLLGLIDRSKISSTDAATWMTFGVPVAIGVISLSAVANIGLMGRLVSEEVREWWARLGGWLLIFALAWMGFCGIALFAPMLRVLPNEVNIPAAGVWAAMTAFGVVGGRSQATSGRNGNRRMEIALSAAPYVFVLGLLVALSIFADWALRWAFLPGSACDPTVDKWTCHWTRMNDIPVETAIALVGCLLGALLLSWRVDVNAFSLQPLYRNRLVRCYLGASHNPRKPHPFTGFDPNDDIRLTDLAAQGHAVRPYPLINVALNLVKSKDLAVQERMAASFTMAPLHCGFYKYYRRTRDYALGRLTLGEAVATSGAAASPNMGYHSNPALAFLMTIFNVRLGMWLGNPRHGKRTVWAASGPRIGLVALLSELLGNTSDDARHVYLSDGGHFDNLGIYELLRRRCRFIIACDASADPHVRFDDLGGVIRKCRTDFGVDISLDTTSLQLDPRSGRSTVHCAVAHIQYPERTHATLVYLKASLTGRETVDVLNYAAGDRTFPHQSTADQWFSESQFESYRRLGYDCARTVFEGVEHDEKALQSLEGTFTSLRERWYPPTGVAEGVFARHAATLDSVNERIRANPRLSFLDVQIVPAWNEFMEGARKSTAARDESAAAHRAARPATNGSAAAAGLWLPDDADARRDGFYLCASVLQLMENVYNDLGLETHCEHPDNRGWMNLFRHWSWCSMLRVTWALTAATYGARFQTFCRQRLDLDIGSVIVKQTSLSHLNFVEQGLARKFTDVKLYGVKLRVLNPDAQPGADASRGSDEAIDFSVGFAAIKGHELVYLRIQDHLRKMGLGRKALRAMMNEGLVKRLSNDQAPVSDHEEVADQEGLRRLFDSVEAEVLPARPGSLEPPARQRDSAVTVPKEV